MSDIQLLKDAAKAAGIELDWDIPTNAKNPWRMTGVKGTEDYGPACEWNPLTDDGDALRLAVKLKFDVWIDGDAVEIFWGRSVGLSLVTHYIGFGDEYAATRRAIVRAAAEIGKTK